MNQTTARGFAFAMLFGMACAWVGLQLGELTERRRAAKTETTTHVLPAAMPDWSAAEKTPELTDAKHLVPMRIVAAGPATLDSAVSDQPYVVMLRDESDAYALPIFIGPAEGQAILRRLAGAEPLRPMTHDLFESTLQRLGGRVTKVVIDDIQSDVFFGFVFFETRDGGFVIDARPSDAITLASGAHAPIFATERVLQRAALSAEPSAPFDAAQRMFDPDDGPSL